MPFCNYKVRNIQGEELKGNCWCSNKRELAMSFRDRGFYIVYYKEKANKLQNFIKVKMNLKELSMLCNSFATLLAAGINIIDIVGILKDDYKNSTLNRSLEEIEKLLYQGEELSTSISKSSALYPDLLINMVKVGEESGKLDKIFKILCQYYENENKIRGKIIKVLTYPFIVTVVSSVVMIFMTTTIIPMLVTTLEDVSAKLPVTTKIILAVNSMISENYLAISPILAFIVGTLLYIRRQETTRIKLDRFKVTNVFTRNLYTKLISVRFSRTLGILLESGIQISKALEVTLSVIDNKFVCKEVEKCTEAVKRGESISSSMEKQLFFPKNLISMAKIGEETGCLDEMLLKVSDIIEEDLYVSIDKLTVLIEPALIIGLSIVIGFMMISVLMPMINLMDSI